jgi:hypothetical protein
MFKQFQKQVIHKYLIILGSFVIVWAVNFDCRIFICGQRKSTNRSWSLQSRSKFLFIFLLHIINYNTFCDVFVKWCIERNILIFIYFVYFLDNKIVSTYGPRGISFWIKNLVSYNWDFEFCNLNFKCLDIWKKWKEKPVEIKKISTNIVI